MRINQNTMAFNSYRNLSATNNAMGKSLEKLSSGFRINRAADDAAGLVISQGLRAQVSGLRQATRNAQDGISVVQTAEGALNEVHSMLNRMRDLAVQSVNASNDDAARTAANEEITQLKEEIARIGSTTKFGSVNLLDGNFGRTAGELTGFDADGSITFAAADSFDVTVTGGSGAVTVDTGDGVARSGQEAAAYLQDQIRAALMATGDAVDAAAAENLTVEAEAVGEGYAFTVKNAGSADVTFAENTNTPLAGFGLDLATDDVAEAATGTAAKFQVGANAGETIEVSIDDITGLDMNGDVLSAANAEAYITKMDDAISSISAVRGELGAVQNRFESTISNLQVTTENLTASESRIRDTDMALEMTQFTRNQILQQAGTSMLAQANQVPQSVLSLLR